MVSLHEMQTASAEQLRQVLSAAHILLADHEPAMVTQVGGILKRFGANDIEYADSADTALDMLGYTSRAFDLVMLRAGLPGDGAHHVLEVLRRQPARLRVTLHGGIDLATLPAPERFAGIARCIDVSGLPGIVRGTAIVLDCDVTLASIARAGLVPKTMTVDWAEAIYGDLPGRPLKKPIRR